MIRTACTWLIIVLAASPFTAPFSTCDVSALLGSHAQTVLIAPSVSASPDLIAPSELGDAGSISPVVGRAVLSRDSALVLTGWPVPAAADTRVRAYPDLVQYGRALDDAPVQSLVLRI